MIKKYFILFLTLQLSVCTLCQTSIPTSTIATKPAIDSAAIANWVDLSQSQALITADGKYFLYSIYNLPIGSNTLVVQSLKNFWKKEFVGVDKGLFSYDSKQVILKVKDTLVFQALGKEKATAIPNVASYKAPRSDNGKWLAYLTKSRELTVLNLLNRKEQRFQNIAEYQFSDDGKVLLIKRRTKTENTTSEAIDWIDLKTNKTYSVWNTPDNTLLVASSFKIHDETKQLVFLVEDKKNSQPKYSTWYYKEGMPKAIEKITNETPGIAKGMTISNNAPFFSKTGNYIFISMHPILSSTRKSNSTGVQVDIWNYKDLLLQPLQGYFEKADQKFPESYMKTEFTASIPVNSNDMRQLENDSEKIVANFEGEKDFVIIVTYKNSGDKTWLRSQKIAYYVVHLKDGKRKYLFTGFNLQAGVDVNFTISPNKEFLVYFNTALRRYLSYDILNDSTKHISNSIPLELTLEELNEHITPNFVPAGVAGWLENGNLLISDNYDLWAIDPSGRNMPQNITNGYGKINKIKFDLIGKKRPSMKNVYPIDKPLILSSFDTKTKQNGFFWANPSKTAPPQLLSVHSSLIYGSGRQTSGLSLFITKAENADVWLVKKQTFSDAPNFYATKDFKNFKQLTDIQPQEKYRWGTTELLSWKTYDGKDCQGILYKPENFDPNKKYPVVVIYYEKESEGLHRFFRPEIPTSELNVPWILSRGYFVFKPDIHYTVGKVTQSVVNSVIPGVYELLKYPFIDSLSIGIHGQSFGGYETNILITESNFFAAAAEGAGASNLISQYGSLLPTERNYGSGVWHQEIGGQHRMTSTMWENQQAYIDNSPIFKADRVTTPLLIRHNKLDEAVPWGQAVEFFIALRRLDKPVWMLQYDEGSHGNDTERDKMDYTTRLTQFFNHFLKGAPAPHWMTEGIPATMKGIETGYDLDPAGNCGTKEKPCKVCRQWNEKWNKDSAAVKEEITQWEKL